MMQSSSEILEGDGDFSSSSLRASTTTKNLAILNRWPEDPPDENETSSPCNFLCRFYSNWTYSYMNVVLRKGAKQKKQDDDDDDDNIDDENPSTRSKDVPPNHLTSDDLYVVPRAMESSKLMTQMDQYYHHELQQQRENASSDDGDDDDSLNDNSPSNYRQKRRRLLKTLWKIAAPTYIPAGICELLVVICGTTLPLLVRELLEILENNPNANRTQDNENKD